MNWLSRSCMYGVCALFAGAVFVCCAPSAETVDAERTIRERHESVMGALVKHDFAALSRLVHASGLLVSLDAWAGDSVDITYSREQLAHAAADTARIQVGEMDGSGDPIYSSLKQEMEGFGNRRYQNADSVLFNTPTQRGNTMNNLPELYPGGIVVEYYFAGTGEQADFNWSSVRFAYTRSGSTWYLTAIAYDHWTI